MRLYLTWLVAMGAVALSVRMQRGREPGTFSTPAHVSLPPLRQPEWVGEGVCDGVRVVRLDDAAVCTVVARDNGPVVPTYDSDGHRIGAIADVGQAHGAGGSGPGGTFTFTAGSGPTWVRQFDGYGITALGGSGATTTNSYPIEARNNGKVVYPTPK